MQWLEDESPQYPRHYDMYLKIIHAVTDSPQDNAVTCILTGTIELFIQLTEVFRVFRSLHFSIIFIQIYI